MNKTKKITLFRYSIYTLMLLILGLNAFSQQRLMEKLNRGTVAVETENGVFLSWRKFALDPDSVTFNVYRNNVLVNPTPIKEISNYLDKAGTADSYYYIEVLQNGEVIETSEPVAVWIDGYKEIRMKAPDDTYQPDDCSVADLDGDGEMEIIVKMENSHKDNSQSGYTNPVYLQAYEMNGTLLWSINLGVNIRAGSHYTQFMVYDLNGDGIAELACKTAPGTMDGTGNYLSDGPAENDDDEADYRNANGYILSGPEYLTLFDGKTGKEMSTVEYVPGRGIVGDWGDTYGNRVDRFLAGVAYFDTTPSLVMCRGYYTRSVLAAWDYTDGELVQRWVFDTDVEGTGADGNPYSLYAGQGAHSLSIGDVDGDGKDEIVYGAMAVDDDGTGLWTTGNNHGDATHLGDFLPDRPGLEYWMPSETAGYQNKVTGGINPGVWLADAKTGEIIWKKEVSGTADVGRAMVDDITADNPGCEFWAASYLGIYDENGNKISFTSEWPSINFGSWWDGDLTREVLSGNAIKKWSTTEKYSLLEPDDCESNNSTKAVPALSGDILGDWREEVIWRTSDNQTLRIYTTTDTTQYGLYTLLQDPQYRQALVWQNVAYNQPPHPSFFLGADMEEPKKPSIQIVEPDVDAFIQITNPSNNNLLQLGNSVNVTLNVVGLSDSSTIYLSNGETLLDSIVKAPYVIKMATLPSGNYSLVAWAYDSEMNKVASMPIHLTVDEGAPHVTLTSPEEGTVYGINDSILLSADAYDSNGSIDHVTFYFNENEVATLTEEPYTIKVENPGYGYYNVYAIATDNDAKTDTSEIRSLDIGKWTTIQENETGFCGFHTLGWIDSNNEGFTGEGFANTDNATGEGISWAINIVEDGDYKFYWRYATNTQRSGTFTINDSIGGSVLEFPSTESWTIWDLQASEEVYLSKGEYEVKLTATSSGGLGNIDYMQILAFGDVAAMALDCDSLGTPTSSPFMLTSDDISLYPNPASGIVNIRIENGNSVLNRVSLYDITGKEMLTKEYSAREVRLDINALSRGIYLVKLDSNIGTCIKKLIVQ